MVCALSAPAPLIPGVETITASLAGGVVLAGAAGTVATIPTSAILLKKALVTKGVLGAALLASRNRRSADELVYLTHY
jgi:hypothetical protein